MGGEGNRYVRDLNLYIRCAAFKAGKPVEDTPICVAYRKEGTYGGKLVPNLRTGATQDEYQIRYDKVHGKHTPEYALDGSRDIRLFLDPKWRGAQPLGPISCKWSVITPGDQKHFSSQDCSPVTHKVDLTISASGAMAWTATVRLNVKLSDGASAQFEDQVTVRDFLIVAMGDSLTSGEGNPERNWTSISPAQWMDYRCHRSLFSYPVMMAATLALADPRHSITLVHVACSGADINEGILGKYKGAVRQDQVLALWGGQWPLSKRPQVPEKWKSYGAASEELASQIDQVSAQLGEGDGRRKPDLLVLSIGVNDMGFVKLLEHLAQKDCKKECLDGLQRRRAQNAAVCGADSDKLSRSFDCLERLLRKVKTGIDAEIQPRQTLLVNYPNPLRDEKNNLCMSKPHHSELLKGVLGTFVESLVSPFVTIGFSEEEITYAENEFYNRLNQAHLKIDAPPSWVTIKLHEDENKRGFCASPKWYHDYQESKLRQHLNPKSSRDSVGTLHPNAIGHEHLMVRVLSIMRRDCNSRRDECPMRDHNFSKLDASSFHNDNSINGHHGLAWIIGQIHKEDVGYYYKF